MTESSTKYTVQDAKAEPSPSSVAPDSDATSSSRDGSSSSGDSNSSDDDSDSSDEDEPTPGLVVRIVDKMKATQHKLLEARRHPVLEWRGAVRWHTENTAGLALAEDKRRRSEECKEAKLAARERKQKRRAQRKLNKQKETEFRLLVQGYDDQLVRSEKRTELLTKFSIDNRAREKRKIAEQQAALQAAQERAALQKIEDLRQEDQLQKAEALRHLHTSIDTADEIARRAGILPAINTPVATPQDEQDETSSLLILRINPPDALPTRSPSGTPLPAFQGRGNNEVSATPSTRSSTLGDASRSSSSRLALTRQLSTTSVATKKLFFTVNLKRFKHTEEIRGEAIGDHGGVELARSLLTGACPRVKRIYLGWNHIKYSGIAALADCFIRGACGQLQILDLRCNSIDARSFQELLNTLEKGGLPELLDLILQGNIIGDEGAKAIAHAMLKGTLQALRIIDVRQNRIRNAGVQAIWNVFTSQCFKRYCPKLQMLDMRRNEASGALTRSFCPCPPYLEF
ncbi:Mitochondrial protein [Globisporangium polare]